MITSKIFIPLLFAGILNAATYDDNYRVTQTNEPIAQNDNTFMKGNFDSIIRYDMINMNEDNDDNSTAEIVDKASKQIKALHDNFKVVQVTIIGHTNRATDDANEQTIDSGTYANKIQNQFRYSLDTNSSLKRSKKYAEDIQKRLVDAGVDKNITYIEARAGFDQGFSDATTQGRDLLNRVMITLYVSDRADIDSDKDGVFDREDKCPNSPRGFAVDREGCSLDSDRDGVMDYKDECPKTPLGVVVDVKGCPLDVDKDGVADYVDKCSDTPLGLSVDLNGCPYSSQLRLNFKVRSDKILQKSYPEIKKFAIFLIENPMYKAELVGHTDSVGKAVTNMELSQRRAASVKAALVAEGVEPSRLSTSGRGELDPITTNRTKEGRAINRRTEIKLSY